MEALVQDRIALFRADSLMALGLIVASALLLLWAYFPKGQTEHAREVAGFGRKWAAALCICVLSAANLFVVGKRYLNADHFTTPKDFGKPFAERPVDQIIKADKDPQYRVLDLTVNVFNSSVPSYHHKSVGGYSPAKLQRYQDLIEHYLTREINGLYGQLNAADSLEAVEAWMTTGTPVLNALNTRYVVLDGNYPPLVNDAALGAAPRWTLSYRALLLSYRAKRVYLLPSASPPTPLTNSTTSTPPPPTAWPCSVKSTTPMAGTPPWTVSPWSLSGPTGPFAPPFSRPAPTRW